MLTEGVAAPQVHLVVALPGEAEPIIAHYDLVASGGRFPLFVGSDVFLTVSGVGKVAAAGATAYLAALKSPGEIWINVGLAGHGSAPFGTALLAHRVTDGETGRNQYPMHTTTPPCQTAHVITLARPSTQYQEAAFDMEASAFFETALRFSTVERIAVLKVISDNPFESIAEINRARAGALCESLLPVLDAEIARLRALDSGPPAPDLDPFLARWHFTVTEQHQLRALLVRHRALAGAPIGCADFQSAKNGSHLLRQLRERVAALPLLGLD